MADIVPWRASRVYPGATFYIWSPQQKMVSGSPTLPAGWTWGQPCRLGGAWMSFALIQITVPATETPGSFTVSWTDVFGAPHSQAVTVIAAPIINATTVSGGGGAAIQTALTAGFNYINLGPGNYQIPTTLTFPGGSGHVTIDGGGWASLTRVDQPAAASNKFFDLTARLTLTGLTFRGHIIHSGDLILHHFPYPDVDVDITRCRFFDCALGDTWGVGSVATLVEDCEFVRAGSGHIPSGTLFNWCTFRDGFAHPIFNNSAAGWCVINCDWTRTARGIVIQGPASDGLVAGCRFFDIAHGLDNAGEVILFEAANETGMTNNSFFMCHMYGCSGPGISLSGGGMNNNWFHDMTIDTRALSIVVNGFTGKIYNNRFGLIEMGAGMLLTGNCEDHSTTGPLIFLRQPLRNGNADANLSNYPSAAHLLDQSSHAAGHGNVFANPVVQSHWWSLTHA